ncbi:Transcription factor IWS1 [Ceratocystis lukuohia]|uniref:Transcription factor IWS1 n=3 Tax=Ceratocystis TaxID=5157 RepID=A0A0F8BK32_CERFI|nr:Transcription factor IWS1 [Ceratocystis platani]PHH49619.1 Transcription factor iws-1 [Ceratocystis fimbriata CBS 114723]
MSDIDSSTRSSGAQEAPINSHADNDDHDLLSEVDDADAEDYDPDKANIEDRPVTIDENIARTLKAARRAPVEAEKKPREGRREKKRPRDEDTNMGDAPDVATRPQKARLTSENATKLPSKAQEDEYANLTPEERRRKELQRVLDAAGKAPKKARKKKGEMDLDDPIDDQINTLVVQMERACQADNDARQNGQPAVHKLRLLPQVVAMMNRNSAQAAVVDPDSSFLRAVRYFLEPLYDGSIPAYNIQRELFSGLMKLPIDKEALLSSGLGKVVFFYTKSKKPEVPIKRMAEKLVGDWSRPILRRTDDYRKRHVETAEYDYQAAKLAQHQESSQISLSQRPGLSSHEAERQRALALPDTSGRARLMDRPVSYTVAPVSTFSGAPRANGDHRPIGASGIDAFRRMASKAKRRNA